jgi:hypothetical protein
MKRKITAAILIFLGLGFLWQGALGQADCKATCRERLKTCHKVAFALKCAPCVIRCDEQHKACEANCHI